MPIKLPCKRKRPTDLFQSHDEDLGVKVGGRRRGVTSPYRFLCLQCRWWRFHNDVIVEGELFFCALFVVSDVTVVLCDVIFVFVLIIVFRRWRGGKRWRLKPETEVA